MFFWNEKVVLQFRFDTDVEKIIIKPRAHDCDFLTAPLGSKNCYYEAVVHQDGEFVYVSWTKVWQ